MAVLPHPEDAGWDAFHKNYSPEQIVKIKVARKAGFTQEEVKQEFERKHAKQQADLGVTGQQGLTQPYVDPTIAFAGGFGGAGRFALEKGAGLVSALVQAGLGGGAAVVTDYPVGVLQEQVTEQTDSGVLGALTALTMGVLTGRIEQRAVSQIASQAGLVRNYLKNSRFRPGVDPVRPSAPKSNPSPTSGSGAASPPPTAEEVVAEAIALRNITPPQPPTPGTKSFNATDIDTITGTSIPTGSTVKKAGDRVIEIEPAAPGTPSADGGSNPERLAQIEALTKDLKRRKGKTITRDPLPDIGVEQARLAVATHLATAKGMPVEDVLVALQYTAPLKLKKMLANLRSTKKRGGQFLGGDGKPGVEIRPTQEAIESLPGKVPTDITPGLQAELRESMRKVKVKALTQRKVVGDVFEPTEKVPLGGSLAELRSSLNKRAAATGSQIGFNLKDQKFYISGDGQPAETFDSLVGLQQALLRKGLVNDHPINEGAAPVVTQNKILSGDELTGTELQKVQRQAKVMRDALNEGKVYNPDIPANVLRVDPEVGRKPGVKAPTETNKPKNGFDPELRSKEELDEIARLTHEQEVDMKQSDPKAYEEELIKQRLDEAEHNFSNMDSSEFRQQLEVDDPDLTFGAGAAQLFAKLNAYFKKGRKGQSRQRYLTYRNLETKGVPLSARRSMTMAIQAQLRKHPQSKKKPLQVWKVMASMKADGIDPQIVKWVGHNILKPSEVTLINPYLQPGVTNDPKLRAALQALRLGDTGARIQVDEMTHRIVTLFNENGIKAFSKEDKMVRAFSGGKVKNAPPNVKRVAAGLQDIYQAFAEQLGKEDVFSPTYQPDITDFETLFKVFKKQLGGQKRWDNLEAQYKVNVGSEKEFNQVQRVLRGNKAWRTVSSKDKQRLKAAFNFKDLVDWDELPKGLRGELPEAMFNGFLLRKTGAEVPTISSAFQTAIQYTRTTSRAIHMQPALDEVGAIYNSISPASSRLGAVLTNKDQIESLAKAAVGVPTGDSKLIEFLAQQLNETVNREVLKVGAIREGVKQVNTLQALGALTINLGVGLGNSTQIVIPAMRNGNVGRLLLKRTSHPDIDAAIKQASGLMSEVADVLQQQDVLPGRFDPDYLKFLEFEEKFGRWALSPLNISENFLRGFTVVSELEAGLDAGLSIKNAIPVSGARANRLTTNFKLSDAVAQAILQDAPNTFRGGALSQSPRLTGPVGRAAAFFTSFPVNALGTFSTTTSEAIRTKDGLKLVRVLATIGSLWSLPWAMEEYADMDIRSIYGPNSLLIKFSAPIFRGMWNLGIMAAGHPMELRIKTVDRAKREFSQFLWNNVPGHNTFNKYVRAERNIKAEAVLDARLRRITEEELMTPWTVHWMMQLGVKDPVIRNARKVLRKLAREKANFQSDFNEGVQDAAKFSIDGGSQSTQAISNIQKRLSELHPNLFESKKFETALDKLLETTPTERAERQFGRNNPGLPDLSDALNPLR